ncbi:MAG: TolC family protein [Opitutaceae bacterium]
MNEPTAGTIDRTEEPASAVPAAPREGLSLAQAIRLTLLNNRTLEKAGLDRETQRFALRVAEDEFMPNLDLSTSALYNPVRIDDEETTERFGAVTAEVSQRLPTGGRVALIWENFGTEITPTDSSPLYDSGVLVRFDQPLLRGAGLKTTLANLRIARLAEESNILDFRQTVMDTITRVIFGYRALLQTNLQLEVTETALQRAREQLRVNRALVEAGILPPVEIVQTEADIASQEFNVLTARSALETARFNLIKLLDIDRDTTLEPSDEIKLPEFTLTLEEARELAYRNRPDYLQSQQGLAIAGISTDVAKDNRLWDLLLSTRYRLDGNDSELDSAIDEALSRSNEDWSVGLTLNVPIGDLTRRQGYLRARNQALKAAIDLVEVRENIEIELRDVFRNIELSQQRVRVSTVARELAERKLEIEKGKLQTGRTTNFAIVTFQNDLVRARLNEISAKISFLNALSNLDQTLGATLDTWGIRMEELDHTGPDSTPASTSTSAPSSP